MASIPTGYETWTDPDTGEVTGGRVVYGLGINDMTMGPVYVTITNDAPEGYDPYADFLRWMAEVEAAACAPAKPPQPKRRGSPNPDAARERARHMRRVR
jgi:hypothetical protein